MSYRVSFFPGINTNTLSLNPYWKILQDALLTHGVCIENSNQGTFGARWLWNNRNQIQLLHLHYIQQFYWIDAKYASLNGVLRLTRNLIIARILGYRTIFTMHNLSPTYPLIPNWIDSLGHLIAANLTDGVIVHCNNAKKSLAKRYGRLWNVNIIDHPNYIDYYPNNILQGDARELLGLSQDDIVFIYFGGIRPNKGIENLLSAFTRIKNSNLRLLIVGQRLPPHSYIDQIQKLAQADPRIQLILNYIPDEDIQVYLNASDIVVLPFKRILTSGSVMLAMSFARPVIVPALGCLPEIIDVDVGWLYEQDNPGALYKSLLKASKSDWRTKGEAALEKVSIYNAERFAQQTLSAYKL